MYNQQQQAQTAYVDQPSNMTLSQSVKEEFISINERQTKLILAIEDKLHDIINKRVPTVDNQKGIENSINDFGSEMTHQFSKMRINTNKLEDILNHLQAII